MPVTSFTADPPRIKKGQSSTLKWTTEGCDNCFLVPPMKGEPEPPNGSAVVSPEIPTVYMLQCQCGAPPNYWTVLVMVDE